MAGTTPRRALLADRGSAHRVRYGLPGCIIFRPEGSAIAIGKRYLVEIEGVTRADTATSIVYPVIFASVK